ncbi:hypothetical protein Anas_11147, partial [Armadillidium nasatum]
FLNSSSSTFRDATYRDAKLIYALSSDTVFECFRLVFYSPQLESNKDKILFDCFIKCSYNILPRFKNKKFIAMSDVFVDNKPKNIFCYKYSRDGIINSLLVFKKGQLAFNYFECYGDTCRRLQVKLLHFNATNQVSSSNLDEEE